jgi:hypothetical protein
LIPQQSITHTHDQHSKVKNITNAIFFKQEIWAASGPNLLRSFIVFASAKTVKGAALTSGMGWKE